MTLGSTSDIAFTLKEAGVPVVYNGTSSYGILDIVSSEFADDAGRARTKMHRLTIATDAFTNLRAGGRITVAGVPYRIDDVELEDGDGALTVLTVARLS